MTKIAQRDSAEIPKELDLGYRLAPQYSEGRAAFTARKPISSCPYKLDKRTSWMAGWYDARTQSRLGHIFHRWGLDWP